MTDTWSVVPVLGARDVRAAADYYVDKLGFRCGSIFPAGEDGSGEEQSVCAILDRAGAQVHLQLRRDRFERDRQRIESDAYFYVDDVDALYEEHLKCGAAIHRGPLDAPSYSMRDYVVEDLDRNRLLFGSPKRAD